MNGDVIPYLGSMPDGTPWPHCSQCDHPWHGFPCPVVTVPLNGTLCDCDSSFSPSPRPAQG